MKGGNIMKRKENSLPKNLKVGIWAFTAIVYVLVMVLHRLPAIENPPGFISILPGFNATINGVSFLILILSLVMIKRGNILAHKALNTAAMVLAVVFLLSYVINHTFSGDTIYGGAYKGLYYFVLITHILLAGLSLPMILFAYVYGWLDIRDKHKKWVKITYPLWLYVTFTGVLVFLFLAPYYN